jgi:hypothetical protein
MGDSRFGRLRQRLSGLGDDDFFALADPIEELGDVGGGFREGEVGDHGNSESGDRCLDYKPCGKGSGELLRIRGLPAVLPLRLCSLVELSHLR